MTPTTFAATKLMSAQRIDLAIQAMSGTVNVNYLAAEHEGSRKFIYQQKEKAQLALDLAFASGNRSRDEADPTGRDMPRQFLFARKIPNF